MELFRHADDMYAASEATDSVSKLQHRAFPARDRDGRRSEDEGLRVPWSVPGPVSGRQNVPCCLVEALKADGRKD